MAGFRKPEISRDQLVLWSQKLDDAIGEWSAQYVLLEGKPPYSPRDLAGLYIYGMLNKLRSSRQLEAACHNRVDVIWLMSGQRPDHSTISAFVKEHGGPLRQMFRDVLEVGIRAGLVKLEHVAVDGTKMEADAGKGSVHRETTIAAQLATLDQRIAAVEKEWADNESRETSLFGAEAPWTPPTGGTPAQQLARLKEQQKRLNQALGAISRRRDETAEGRTSKPIASVTDPDSRAMPDKEGKTKPNYNAQIAVDTTAGLVVAQAVNDRAEDNGQMTPLLEQVKENCGSMPAEASADSGYNTGPELAKLESMQVTAYLPDSGQRSTADPQETPATQAVAAAQSGATLTDEQWTALPKDEKGRITKDAFVYDREANVYRCPMGQSLPFLRYSTTQRGWGRCVRSQYGGCAACALCPRVGMCCSNPTKGRTVNRDQYEDHRERMRERMKSPEGRVRYRLRGQTVEPRFGHIKRGLGIRRFLRRGLNAVHTEWSLICTAMNIGILLKNWTQVQKAL